MMLSEMFGALLEMALTSSVVILAVLLVRALMYRLPKKFLYLLWLVVGIRLLCPVAISSPISIFNWVNLPIEEMQEEKQNTVNNLDEQKINQTIHPVAVDEKAMSDNEAVTTIEEEESITEVKSNVTIVEPTETETKTYGL